MRTAFEERIAAAIEDIAAEATPSDTAFVEIERRIAADRRGTPRTFTVAAVAAAIVILLGAGLLLGQGRGQDAGVTSGMGRLVFDFEQGPEETLEPVGWTPRGRDFGYQVRAVDDRSVTGRWSARVMLTGEVTGHFSGGIRRCVPAADAQGRRVRLSGQVATESAGGDGAVLWVRADASGTPLLIDNALHRALVGTHGFTPMEVSIDVPDDADELCFGGMLLGRGTAWFDDLVLEVIDGDAAPGEAVSMPDELTNLGFEDGAAPSGLPMGWRWSGRPSYQRAVSRGAHSGAASGRLEWVRDSRESAPAVLTQCVERGPLVEPGTVQVSAWVRTFDVVDGTARLRVDTWSGAGDQHKADAPVEGIAGTTPWQQLSATFDVPPDTTELCVQLLLSGRGAAEIDDVEVRRLR